MNRVISLAALASVVIASSSCAGEGDRAIVTSDSPGGSAAALFDAATPSREVVVGDSSVHETSSASEAIAFVTTELYSQRALTGQQVLGSGPVIATFVEPACRFSAAQSQLLIDAAVADAGISYVFIHSGGDAEAFMAFASDAGLSAENVVHIDDRNGALSQRFGIEAYPSTLLVDEAGRLSSSTGALDSDRLDRAVSIVRSGEDA